MFKRIERDLSSSHLILLHNLKIFLSFQCKVLYPHWSASAIVPDLMVHYSVDHTSCRRGCDRHSCVRHFFRCLYVALEGEFNRLRPVVKSIFFLHQNRFVFSFFLGLIAIDEFSTSYEIDRYEFDNISLKSRLILEK